MPIFKDITILDLTRVLSGPLATRHFADQGANVIKIEPINGDDTRQFPPLIDNWSGYFEILNRNKKSLVLDLKSQKDLLRFYDLCQTADVIVQNFAPGVTAKLKIDYDTVKSINPKLVYTSLHGISKDNPRKYYDIIAQAETGLISLNKGHVSRTAIIDTFSGMKLAFAVSSALYSREKTGKGMEINVSMKGCAMDLLEQNLVQTSINKTNPNTEFDTAICPFGVFRTQTKDIAVGIGNDILWQKFVELLVELNSGFDFTKYQTNQVRLDNAKLINSQIQNIFSYHTAKFLQVQMQSRGIPSGLVNTMTDVINDLENYQGQVLQKVQIDGVGEIVIPVGGIDFSNHLNVKYKPAPQLNDYEL
jgi:CoA:oxalate CoA-transferase